MSQSTWHNTLNGLHAAVHDSYAAKSARQRNKREVQDVMRDMKIAHDWSGFYYDGTVYTDAEEEEMICKQFNIPM